MFESLNADSPTKAAKIKPSLKLQKNASKPTAAKAHKPAKRRNG